MKFDFTPGPWHIAEKGLGNKEEFPTVYAANEELIYVATCSDCLTREPTNNLANARLIATAPEMLEALISIVRTCDSFSRNVARDEQKKVIEKATGKTWEEIKC